MLGRGHLAFAAFAYLAVALAAARAEVPPAGIVPVKLGLQSLSQAERANLWRLVDEYATVDALQEFCGIKLNLQRRAWKAVGACVEVTSLRRVLSTFRTKKAKYLKDWESLHGEPEQKKQVCERFKAKLKEYARTMSGQIEQAASMCRNCFFC